MDDLADELQTGIGDPETGDIIIEPEGGMHAISNVAEDTGDVTVITVQTETLSADEFEGRFGDTARTLDDIESWMNTLTGSYTGMLALQITKDIARGRDPDVAMNERVGETLRELLPDDDGVVESDADDSENDGDISPTFA